MNAFNFMNVPSEEALVHQESSIVPLKDTAAQAFSYQVDDALVMEAPKYGMQRTDTTEIIDGLLDDPEDDPDRQLEV